MRLLVLGGGISGLATAWYLAQAAPSATITLLEKADRIGGFLQTDHTSGFHFEKGPRTFKIDQSPALLQLTLDLGLKEQILCASQTPFYRYLWWSGKLRRFPHNPLSFVLSPLTRGFVRAAFAEWKRPAVCADETVWDFALRRFNRDVAMRFFDPMVVGIFGGDARRISVRACFSKLKAWEERYGSITKGFFCEGRNKPQSVHGFPARAMFSFAEGIEELVRALREKTRARFCLNCEVQSVRLGREITITTAHETFSADALFCALPMQEAARLFSEQVPEFEGICARTPKESLAVVSLGYDRAVLQVRGFGYLVPTYAKEEILGVVFDSHVFPEHNQHARETRLTVKIEDKGGSDQDYIDAALKGVKKHLGLASVPKAITLKRVREALPQYEVGHLETMAALNARFRQALPSCFLVGNYISGVGVNACIERAQQVVKEWEQQQVMAF